MTCVNISSQGQRWRTWGADMAAGERAVSPALLTEVSAKADIRPAAHAAHGVGGPAVPWRVAGRHSVLTEINTRLSVEPAVSKPSEVTAVGERRCQPSTSARGGSHQAARAMTPGAPQAFSRQHVT